VADDSASVTDGVIRVTAVVWRSGRRASVFTASDTQ
jgi:hypothetical protein